MEFKSFNSKHRIPVNLDELPFGVLRELFEVGDRYVTELEELKVQSAKEKPEGSPGHHSVPRCRVPPALPRTCTPGLSAMIFSRLLRGAHPYSRAHSQSLSAYYNA